MKLNSEFNPLSAADFDNIESACGIRLSDEHRSEVNRALKRYHDSCAYEASGEGKKLLGELAELPKALNRVAESARKLDEDLPGHLWTNTAADAGVDGPAEIQRLFLLAKAFAALDAKIRDVRSRKTRDFKSAYLLLALEEIYYEAMNRPQNRNGRRKTGVSNTTGERTSHFVSFCTEVIGHLPKAIRLPPNSIGTRWERLYRERNRNTDRGKSLIGVYVWVGKTPPGR